MFDRIGGFFNFNVLVHHTFLPYGRTVSKVYHFMRSLRQKFDEDARNIGEKIMKIELR